MQNIKKYFMTLALLLTAVTGAWAQGLYNVFEVTQDMVASWTNDKTAVSAADLPTFGAVTEDEAKAWTGAPATGLSCYLIYDFNGENTKYVKFTDGKWSSVGEYYWKRSEMQGDISDGYKLFYTGLFVIPGATAGTWTFSMPGSDVELQVEYYPGMLVKPTNLVGGTLSVVGLTAPFTKLDVPATWEDDNTLLSAAHLPGLKEMTDAEAQNWTDVPNGYVILIYGFDGTKAKMATYIDGELTFPSTEEVTLYQLKTASADAEIYYSSEAQMPAGFETDGTNYYVAKDTKFTVKAVPAEGYHLVGWSDDATIKDLEREFTMTDDDFNVTATFSDAYDIAFQAANALTIEAGKATVTVGGTAATVTEGKLEGVKMGSEVKLKANTGYKFRKVEVKKKAEVLTITVAKGSTDLSGDKLLYYTPGETYRQAIANHPENKLDGGLGWNIWESGNDATIFYKESADKDRDLSIDGYQHFGPTDSINLDTVIDPTLNFYFVAPF